MDISIILWRALPLRPKGPSFRAYLGDLKMKHFKCRPGIQLLARFVASRLEYLDSIATSILPRSNFSPEGQRAYAQSKERVRGLEDLFPEIARYYYLMREENIRGLDEQSYGFSLRDYLEYRPSVIAQRRNCGGKWLDLSSLRLFDLDGLCELSDFPEVLRICYNHLTELHAEDFRAGGNLKD